MSKTIRNLSLLFAAQVVLAIFIWLSHGGQDHRATKAFIAQDLTQADKVTVTAEQSSVTLARVGDEWRLPEYGNLLVANNKLENAIKKLSENQVQWPAATSASAQSRFEVSENNAQKTLTFYKGEKVISTVFLGTSPSFRKLHARTGDNNEIYTINFSQNDFPEKSEEWFDRSLLKFDGDITTVKTANFNLNKESDAWSISPIQAKKTANQDAIKNWATRFTQLVVNSRVADSEVEKITVQNPVLTAELRGTDSKGIPLEKTYAFYKNDEKFYIRTFGEKHVFEIAKYSVEPIINAEASEFQTEQASDHTDENVTDVPAS